MVHVGDPLKYPGQRPGPFIIMDLHISDISQVADMCAAYFYVKKHSPVMKIIMSSLE